MKLITVLFASIGILSAQERPAITRATVSGQASSAYHLLATPAQISVLPGSSAQVTVEQTVAGFAGLIDYSVFPPSGFTATTATVGNTATVSVTADGTVPPDSQSTIVIQGLYRGVAQTIFISVSVPGATRPAAAHAAVPAAATRAEGLLDTTGSITVSSVPSTGQSIDFTALGSFDWMETGSNSCGYNGPCASARKTGGSGLTPFTNAGGGDGWFYSFAPGLANVTWSDSSTPPPGGASHVNNSSVSFAATAGTDTRMLTLVAGSLGGGTITTTVHLTDGTTPDKVDQQVFTGTGVRVFTIKFTSATAGKQVIVTLTRQGGEILVYGTAFGTSAAPPPTPGGTGSMVISSVASTGQTVDFTALGTLDWIQTGSTNCAYNGPCASARKSGGNGLTPFTNAGGFDGWFYTFTPNLANLTWSDSSAPVSKTAAHINNSSVSFAAIAGTGSSTLTLVAGSLGGGTIATTLHLTDGSAADVTDQQVFGGNGVRVFSIRFNAATAGSQINITMTRQGGEILLYGAALSATPQAPPPPPPPATNGAILISSVAATGQTVDFTALGTLDWIETGPSCTYNGPCASARKNGGAGLTPFVNSGGFDGWFYTFTPNLVNVTWSDSAVAPSGIATHVNNSSVSFTATAGTDTRTLTLVAGSLGGGTITTAVHLNDGQTADVIDQRVYGGTGVRVMTIQFNAATASRQLTVTLTRQGGEILLYGAAFGSSSVPPPPPPPPPPGGSIGITSVLSSGQSIDFTALGTADWIALGSTSGTCLYNGPCANARKNNGTGLLPFSNSGGGDGWFYPFNSNLANVTWSDSTLAPNGGAAHVNNSSVAFGAFASSTETRTLTFVAGSIGGGTITTTFHVTDGTTADVTDTRVFNGSGARVYTVKFKASTAGHHLIVTMKRQGGEILVYGAALTGTLTPETHSLTLTDNIQTFVQTAAPGDTLLLPDGYKWTGHLVLPVRLATGWVDIKSNTTVLAGQRVIPGELKVVMISPDQNPVVQNDFNNPDHSQRPARGWRFTGIEFTAASNNGVNYGIIAFQFGSNPLVSDIARDITFDRCYIHGDGVSGYRKGVIGNANNISILNSYISGFVSAADETNAINIFSSAGPINIINNYLEASGENIMIGGTGPDVGPAMIPTNGVIQHNYFFKPVAWRGSSYIVKNLLEFKNGYNFVVDSNVFENCWLANQGGFALLLTPRTGQGGTIANHIDGIAFTNNIVSHVGSGLNIASYDDLALDANGLPVPPALLQLVHDITLRNNLFDDLSLKYASYSHAVQIFGPPNNLVMDHNTFNFAETTNDHGWYLVGNAGLLPSNGLITGNDFGADLYGDGRAPGPTNVLLGSSFTGNNMRNASTAWGSSPYAATNTYNTTAPVGVGADVAGLLSRQAGVKNGNRP